MLLQYSCLLLCGYDMKTEGSMTETMVEPLLTSLKEKYHNAKK